MMDQKPKSCFELRAALNKHYMRQSTLARMCGVGRQQAWRWCDGSAPIPAYVWTILALMDGHEKWKVMRGDLPSWNVERHHVYRGKRDYKSLAKRFHPDATGRNTTVEMQLINKFREERK